MLDIPRRTDVHGQRPPWWRSLNREDGLGATAGMVCPHGHYGTLHDHEIAADGTVTPSVQCAVANCDFHEMIRLVDWV